MSVVGVELNESERLETRYKYVKDDRWLANWLMIERVQAGPDTNAGSECETTCISDGLASASHSRKI